MENRNYYLAHHGIVGMKWGKRNGPPYPLNASTHNKVVKRANKPSSIKVGGMYNRLSVYDEKTAKRNATRQKLLSTAIKAAPMLSPFGAVLAAKNRKKQDSPKTSKIDAYDIASAKRNGKIITVGKMPIGAIKALGVLSPQIANGVIIKRTVDFIKEAIKETENFTKEMADEAILESIKDSFDYDKFDPKKP